MLPAQRKTRKTWKHGSKGQPRNGGCNGVTQQQLWQGESSTPIHAVRGCEISGHGGPRTPGQPAQEGVATQLTSSLCKTELEASADPPSCIPVKVAASPPSKKSLQAAEIGRPHCSIKVLSARAVVSCWSFSLLGTLTLWAILGQVHYDSGPSLGKRKITC